MPAARSKSASPKARNRGAREKLLAAAGELFYKHGVNAVGIDRVIAKAGVAKMSLYHHFDSKDDLVAAWLQEKHTAWMSWLVERVERVPVNNRPRELFAAMDEWFHTPDFKGCAFINAAAEAKDPRSKTFQICTGHTSDLHNAIKGWIAASHPALGADSLALAAQDITMIVAGAITWAWMHGPDGVAERARHSALLVLHEAR